MEWIIEGIKLVGGIAGLMAFAFKLFEELKGYLKIKVQVNSKDNFYSVQTEIENISKWSKKKITNAFIIISKEDSSVLQAGKTIANYLGLNENEINTTNDFLTLTSNNAIYIDQQVAFIPVEFYYSENVWFGDEKISYCCSIEKGLLRTGTYSVRFYIYGEKRLHRSTQDLLTLTNS